MKSNGYLVTYDDLTTMGLTTKGTAPTGNQIATKDFINTWYYANQTNLAPYASNRCPPYEAISPAFGATVNWASGVCAACNSPSQNIVVAGNGTTFCNSTSYTSSSFATWSPGNYVLAYGGNSVNISTNGTTTATMYGGGCQTCPTTNPSYVSQGYQYCSSCVTYNVYIDANSCSPTYAGYFLENSGTYTYFGPNPPANTGACNYAPNWVVTPAFECVGCTKYYVEHDTNPCSPTYNQTRRGSVWQYNSPDCCPPTVTCYTVSSSYTYTDSTTCPGYTDTFETITITIKDQYGNPINVGSNLTFTYQYDYAYNYDYDSGSGTSTGNTVTVTTGHSTAVVYLNTYINQRCLPSDICGGCYDAQNNFAITDAPLSLC